MLLCLMALWWAPPSEAILGVADTAIVFDPSNYGINILTQTNTLRSTLNEAVMLQNEAKSLQYELQNLWDNAANLTKSPLQLLGRIQGLWAAYTQLMHTADGLTYTLDQARSRFETAYPKMPRTDLTTITSEAARMQQNIRAASATAVNTQSVYDRLGQQMASNNQALSAAQASVGALQIGQAQAQLDALQNEQLAGLTEIEAATGRVQTEWIAMQVKERQDGDAINAKFMQGYGQAGFKKVGESAGVELK
jgi:P-type conjugative transfer protein TrbJ